MKRHVYAFGSLCRGEFDVLSDIDLLACVETQGQAREFDSRQFSVYTYDRLRALWLEGNPFAWHLHLESKPLFSSDGTDFLMELGAPNLYQNAGADCAKFNRLFNESLCALTGTLDSQTFHLSCIFLATRNFATCHSFTIGRPNFSRLSPLQIATPAPISPDAFDVFVRARVLSTRGIGSALTKNEVALAKNACPAILGWMSAIAPSEVLT